MQLHNSMANLVS